MKTSIFDVIVIGGGPAGLSASYYLQKQGLNHIVFERGKIGESWRSQRWDSFRLNSINKYNQIPGSNVEFKDSGGFTNTFELLKSFEDSVRTNKLPVLENSNVISVDKQDENFDVVVSTNGSISNYSSRQIIIASGDANKILVPSFANNISAEFKQMHSSLYRNATQLPDGAVLVIGGGSSGVQVAEDLVEAERKVYLSTSMVARTPRWYRGRDIMDWLVAMNFFEMKAEDIEDPVMLKLKPPQMSGTGGSKYTISLQLLAKNGVHILGKVKNADGNKILLENNAAQHVRFADEFSKRAKQMIDGFILQTNQDAPPAEFDENDQPDENASCASTITDLNLEENNIRTIIWATGFKGDFSYLKLPVFDDSGQLQQKNGIPDFPGIYFLGLHWLFARRSTLLFGIVKDAELVAEKTCERHNEITSNLMRQTKQTPLFREL